MAIDIVVAKTTRFCLKAQVNPSRLANDVTDFTVAGGRNYDVIGQATVLYDFQSRSSQELGLRKHQVVNVISKAGDERGWWKGEYDGRVGPIVVTFTRLNLICCALVKVVLKMWRGLVHQSMSGVWQRPYERN